MSTWRYLTFKSVWVRRERCFAGKGSAHRYVKNTFFSVTFNFTSTPFTTCSLMSSTAATLAMKSHKDDELEQVDSWAFPGLCEYTTNNVTWDIYWHLFPVPKA